MTQDSAGTPALTNRRPFLALFRAGKNSLHPKLTQRLEEQNFDYALSWYGDDDPAALGMADGAAFVHRVTGQKWPGLLATLTECHELIAGYDYVWFPDDDLLCEPENVSEFFTIVDQLKLDLAQPALTPNSYFVHPIVLQHAAFQVRFTNFVELMCPLMSRDMLARALPTMSGTLSGWGVDAAWPRLTRTGRIAIVDSTPIQHTRPILGGNGYHTNQSAGVSMQTEEMQAFERYGVRYFDHPHLNYAGLLQDGNAVCLGGAQKANAHVMLQHVIGSVAPLPLSPLALARYLGDHADFVKIEDHAQLPVVLDEELAGTGIEMPRNGRR